MRLRVATFNVENLSSRWRDPDMLRREVGDAFALAEIPDADQRVTAQMAVGLGQEDDKRQLTALALAQTRADILCLQEVDSLRSLEAFFKHYVHRVSDLRYGHFALQEGNDRRGIDVAFAARRDLVQPDGVRVTSHREATFQDLDVYDPALKDFGVTPQDRVFARDCLQVDMTCAGRPLSVFVCDFKSMDLSGRDDGRDATIPLRRAEARAVRRIVTEHFGTGWRDANWIVAGDLNDFVEQVGRQGRVLPARPSGVEPLLDHFAVHPAASLPPHERWSYFHRAWSYDRDSLTEAHVLLDYVLLSPGLARGAQAAILRSGLPYRAPLDPRAEDRSIAALISAGGRYPRIGWDRPKASDHCPVVVSFDL